MATEAEINKAKAELDRLKTQIIDSRAKRLKRWKKSLLMDKVMDMLIGATLLMLLVVALGTGRWYSYAIFGAFAGFHLFMASKELKLDLSRYTNEQELAHMEGALLYSADLLNKVDKEKTEHGEQSKATTQE